MQSIRKGLALGATAVIAMSTVTAGTAHAGTATNFKYEYLTNGPTAGMPVSYKTRRIYLAAGTYSWIWKGNFTGVCYRSVYLGEGWYTWINQLWPRDFYYQRWSYLDPDNAAWGTAVLRCSPAELKLSGSQTWGTTLNR